MEPWWLKIDPDPHQIESLYPDLDPDPHQSENLDRDAHLSEKQATQMLVFFQAIAEIINSEKSYLSQLEIVEEFFMKPIQESGFLPQQVFAAIFGDILGIRYDKSVYLGQCCGSGSGFTGSTCF